MNPPNDETLMAYADGELDAAARADIERAMASDAALAQRVRQYQALRTSLAAAFAPQLDEAPPERLLQAVAHAPAAAATRVVDLAAARGERASRRAWTWAQWGGMAASVVIGVALGRGLWGDADAVPFALQGGRLVAHSAVAQALSTQAAGPVANSPVTVKISFIDRSGHYCRAFTTGEVAGLACRDAGAWAVQLLTPQSADPAGGMRQAASSLPDEILRATDRRIVGEPLDAAGERAALGQGWQR